MDMEQAATFLAASILLTIGTVVIIAGIILVNNLIHKYWKPVKVFTPESWTAFNPPESK